VFVAALTTCRGKWGGGWLHHSNCETVVKVTASHAQVLAALGLVDSGDVDIHPGAEAAGGQFNFLEVRLECGRGVCDDCVLCADHSQSVCSAAPSTTPLSCWWSGNLEEGA
jgi:hypothetical protein